MKVCVSSSLIFHQILVDAKNLRKSAKYKTVFLSPDRTPEQREARKELIVSMRAKAITEPNKKFYIKDGQILSTDRKDFRILLMIHCRKFSPWIVILR